MEGTSASLAMTRSFKIQSGATTSAMPAGGTFHLSIYPCIYLYLSIHVSIYLYLSIYLSIYISIYMYTYPLSAGAASSRHLAKMSTLACSKDLKISSQFDFF